MPIEILMPALSPTMTEGNLAKWLKKEGDEVHSGDVLAEIETDKATMEVEAVDDGKIGKILVPEGAQGIKVNEPIALLLGEGEDASALQNFTADLPKPAPDSTTTARRKRRNLRRPRQRFPQRESRQREDFRQPAGAPHGAAGRSRPRCDPRLGTARPHRQIRHRGGPVARSRGTCSGAGSGRDGTATCAGRTASVQGAGGGARRQPAL